MGDGRDSGRWWLWLAMSVLSALLKSAHAPTVPKDRDAVNVISVENMDALLRLRLGAEVLSLNRSGLTRSRRATTTLCEKPACNCVKTGNWLNVSCTFSKQEVIQLGPSSVPYNLYELHLDNAAQLIIGTKTFSNTTALHRVVLSRVGRLHVQTAAFTNISAASFIIKIEASSQVVFERNSFRYMGGSVSAVIANCQSLTLGNCVFSRLLNLSIQNVPKVDLVEGTFSDATKSHRLGPAALILFQNATFNIIPNGTFVSSAKEIGFRNCEIGIVSQGAFRAMVISRVFFENTHLSTIESGAFSEGTLIQDFEFNGAHIQVVESGVLAAVSKLTVQKSSFDELREGAFNMTAAQVHLIDNFFKIIKRRAFEIREWNDVNIDGNVFDHLAPEAFFMPFQKVNSVERYDFMFTNNEFTKIDVSALDFLPSDYEVQVHLWDNRFHESCSCRLRAWSSSLVTTSSTSANRLYETSHCSVTDWLAQCFKLHAGAMRMTNYTENICGPGNEVLCEQPKRSHYLPDEEIQWNLLLDKEKKVISLIFCVVLVCVSVIILVVAVRWIQRKGLFGRLYSQYFQTSSLVTTASISRVNIHEYAEIQNLRNQTQIVEEPEEYEMVAIDDKATQTLPEELTQDLLQTLREKLDDPENYKEAREMIEHLYDLIKVEESCNNRISTILEEDVLYEEVQPRMRPRTRNREISNKATRSPSLDKLDPVHYLPRPAVVNDYAEPRDRQVASHVYCELPGGVPDVLMSSRSMINRPLPDAPSGSHV